MTIAVDLGRKATKQTNKQTKPNFIYAFILTRSGLGLMHVIFRTFVPELWPLIYAKILFSFNMTRSTLGLLHIIFRIFVPELWSLIYAKILFPLIILRTN